MVVRRVRGRWVLALGVPGLVACTTLLGDFEVDDTSTIGPTLEAGSDAFIEAATLGDASADAPTEAAADAGVAPKPCGIDDPFESTPTLIGSLDQAAYDDRAGRLTPDGQWLLFGRSLVTTGADRNIWIAKWNPAKSTWDDPRELKQLSSAADDNGATFVPGPTPRIFFNSDRVGGAGSIDLYYANVKSADFSDISPPVRFVNNGGVIINSGGLEASAYVVPSAKTPGAGRMFFARFVPVNHADIFYSDFDANLTFAPVVGLSSLNLPDPSQDSTPALAPDALYFQSTRVVAPDGGMARTSTGVDSVPMQVWVSRLSSKAADAKFNTPTLVPALSLSGYSTDVGSISADGCTFIVSSDRPGGSGPSGTNHLYVAHRRRPL